MEPNYSSWIKVIDHCRRIGLMEHTSNHHNDRIWLGGTQIALVVTSSVWNQSPRAQKFLLSFLFFYECTWPLIGIPKKGLETPSLLHICKAVRSCESLGAIQYGGGLQHQAKARDCPNINGADVTAWTLKCTCRRNKKQNKNKNKNQKKKLLRKQKLNLKTTRMAFLVLSFFLFFIFAGASQGTELWRTVGVTSSKLGISRED